MCIATTLDEDDDIMANYTGFVSEQEQVHVNIHVTRETKRIPSSRVRFYPELALKHEGNVRLSALVYYMAGWITAKRKRGAKLEEYDPCHKFGEAIGVSTKQVYRLLKKAKAIGILDYRHSFNATTVWFTNEAWSHADTGCCMAYDKELADQYGINGAMILCKIAYHTLVPAEGRSEGMRGGYQHFAKKFPWMSLGAIKLALYRLRDKRVIDWDEEGCAFGSKRYWMPCMKAQLTPEERVTDTVRRSAGLKPDSTRLAGPQAPTTQVQALDRKTCSPRFVPKRGTRNYSLDEEMDAADL